MALTESEELELLELENEEASALQKPAGGDSLGFKIANAIAYPPSVLNPELGARVTRSFLGIKQPEPQGFAQHAAGMIGDVGLQGALSTAGQIAGTGYGGAAGILAGLPGGPAGAAAAGVAGAKWGGAAGAGLGAGIGTGLQELARFGARKAGADVPEETIKQAVSNIGVSAAGNAAASLLIPKVIGAIPKIGDYLATSKIGGSIAKPAWEFFKENTAKVLKYVEASPEVGDAIVNDLRSSIGEAVVKLENVYRAGAQKLSSSKNPIRISLNKNLEEVFANIARDAEYIGEQASSVNASAFMDNVMNRVRNMGAASPYDIYKFQRALNSHIDDAFGSGKISLAKNYLLAKDAIRLFIEDHPQLKSIAGMNKAWNEASNIDKMARKFTGKNDLLDYLRRAFGKSADTLEKRNIEAVGQMVPDVAEQVANARAFNAARSITPLVRGMTGTGFETAPGIAATAAYAVEHPIRAAITAPFAPLLSPRLYALTKAYGPNMTRVAASPLTQAASIGGATLVDFYRRQSSQPR